MKFKQKTFCSFFLILFFLQVINGVDQNYEIDLSEMSETDLTFPNGAYHVRDHTYSVIST